MPARTKELASTCVPSRESVETFTPPQCSCIVRQPGVPLPARSFLPGFFASRLALLTELPEIRVLPLPQRHEESIPTRRACTVSLGAPLP